MGRSSYNIDSGYGGYGRNNWYNRDYGYGRGYGRYNNYYNNGYYGNNYYNNGYGMGRYNNYYNRGYGGYGRGYGGYGGGYGGYYGGYDGLPSFHQLYEEQDYERQARKWDQDMYYDNRRGYYGQDYYGYQNYNSRYRYY